MFKELRILNKEFLFINLIYTVDYPYSGHLLLKMIILLKKDEGNFFFDLQIENKILQLEMFFIFTFFII